MSKDEKIGLSRSDLGLLASYFSNGAEAAKAEEEGRMEDAKRYQSAVDEILPKVQSMIKSAPRR